MLAEGISGLGEITCGENPFYNEEWTDSAWLIARDYAAPRLLGHDFTSDPGLSGTFYTPYSTTTGGPAASLIAERFQHIRGHRNVKRAGKSKQFDQ